MRKANRGWILLVAAMAMLVVPGCNDDDDPLDVPADQAVEAGLNAALPGTVQPVVEFYAALGSLLSAPRLGIGCPDTSEWCSSGTASCTITLAGSLAFDFDECTVVTGDEPLTVDGDITAVPGSTITLTMTNLFLNTSPAINGTGTINQAACRYGINIATADAAVGGAVVICDDDNYPTGETLVITFGDFLVTITFDGTNVAHAAATRAGAPVATCTINLDADPLTSSCD